MKYKLKQKFVTCMYKKTNPIILETGCALPPILCVEETNYFICVNIVMQ